MCGIPNTMADDELDSTVISVLADADIKVDSSDIKDYFQTGKPDKANSKKLIKHFPNTKYCKKALLNRKKLIECVGFNPNTKIFANKNLILINQNNAYNCRKLKLGGLLFACFARDGIAHILLGKLLLGKSFKIHHMNILLEMFPEFGINDVNHDEGGPPNQRWIQRGFATSQMVQDHKFLSQINNKTKNPKVNLNKASPNTMSNTI